jgi:glutaredoxin
VPLRRIRLYGKPGCHLCEQAEELLEDLGREHPLAVEMIDITSDPALFERYRFEIPVIILDDGRSIFGRIGAGDLRALLQDQASAPRSI